MPLTFHQLREKSTESLEDRERVLQQALELREQTTEHRERKNAASRISYARRRIQNLLEERANVEDLATTQAQREAYGVQEWHEQFTFARDELSHIARKKLACLQNTKFGRFQRAFSHSHHYAVPTIPCNARELPVDGVQVDADRIPDKLAETLGLVQFSDNQKPYERLQAKAAPSAIAKLKHIWNTAQPITPNNQRLLVIGPEVGDSSLAGTILYTRNRSNGDTNGHSDALEVQHFTSVYNAFRKTTHEDVGHSNEVYTLTSLCTKVQNFADKVCTTWRRDTDDTQKQDLVTEAGTLVHECEQSLGNCQDAHKVDANQLLQTTQELRDSLGRQNPRASVARLQAAANQLLSRLQNIQPISGFNRQDAQVLLQQLQIQTKTIDAVLQQVTMNDVTSLLANRLHHVTLQPLTVYASALQEKVRQLDAESDDASEILLQMHDIGRLYQARQTFERMKYCMVNGSSVSVQTLQQHIAGLRTLCVDSNMHAELAQAVQEIDDRLRHYCDQSLDSAEQLAMQRRLKQYLESFDIEAMVQEL